MKLVAITIVLDGMPFLPMAYEGLRHLKDMDWFVVEGVAANNQDTAWCAPQTPRLSNDGTTQWLEEITKFDKRVRHFKKEQWHSKVAMFNEVMRWQREPCVVMQIDGDEVWTTTQLELIRLKLSTGKENCARFHCRYFLGPDIIITSENTFGNNDAYEWHRAWRVQPGARFASHEPPKIEGFNEVPLTQAQTEKMGLVFDHFSYATEKQVAFKCAYYGSANNKENGHRYKDGVEGWRRLQEAKMPCADVAAYLPWVGKGVTCDRI